jgi:glycosyltransferase involved in cell wall biosynthesis
VNTLHGYELYCPKALLLKKKVVCQQTVGCHCILCAKSHYGLAKSLACYYGVRTNKDKLKSVDKFIAVSSFVKEANCQALRLKEEDVVVIPNFYAGATAIDNAKAGDFPQDFILFVGFLWPHKGVDVLIEAYQKLNTPTKLVLIGYMHPDYRYKSRENLLVIENAPHDTVMAAMSRCRFAVFPSIWPDPAPTVAYEAMSQRKAVIASATGGLKDIVVDRESGLLVPPGDSGRLGEAMALLLEKPEKASEMGERGYHLFLQNYTPEVVIPRTINLYQSLIQAKGEQKCSVVGRNKTNKLA